METAIQLHQVTKVLPPFPALAVRFPSSHAAPQPSANIQRRSVSSPLPAILIR